MKKIAFGRLVLPMFVLTAFSISCAGQGTEQEQLEITAVIDVGGFGVPSAIEVGGGSVWVAHFGWGRVVRVPLKQETPSQTNKFDTNSPCIFRLYVLSEIGLFCKYELSTKSRIP